MTAYAQRTGRDPPAHFVIGNAASLVERLAEYVDAGLPKLLLLPVGFADATMLAQTRQVLEQVLPLAAARWPKSSKRAGNN